MSERATYGNDEYLAAVRRMIRAAGRRVGEGDVEALRDLVGLLDEVERAVDVALVELLDESTGYSLADVGRVLGIARQNAHKRHQAARRRLVGGAA